MTGPQAADAGANLPSTDCSRLRILTDRLADRYLYLCIVIIIPGNNREIYIYLYRCAFNIRSISNMRSQGSKARLFEVFQAQKPNKDYKIFDQWMSRVRALGNAKEWDVSVGVLQGQICVGFLRQAAALSLLPAFFLFCGLLCRTRSGGFWGMPFLSRPTIKLGP